MTATSQQMSVLNKWTTYKKFRLAFNSELFQTRFLFYFDSSSFSLFSDYVMKKHLEASVNHRSKLRWS